MAPGFLRTLSQRLAGNKAKQRRAAAPPPAALPPAGESRCPQAMPSSSSDNRRQQCRVQLLDQTSVDLLLPVSTLKKSALGQELYDRVFAQLDLEERDYFGLQFTDHFQVHHWLDPAKKIRKQVPIGPPYTFRFRVKFFSSEPANLREELTRYQFFLQLRHDIQSGRLECPREVVVELAALALQSEFGDFNSKEHSPEFVSEFRFHPAQDEQMERDILRHFGTHCPGLSPSQAELAYLNRARLLDFYGVDMHPVEGRDGNTYRLGLTPIGMQVFDGPQKIGLFVWSKIQRLDFRGRKLTLVVEEDLEQPKSAGCLIQLHTFVFELSSHKACKHLWKCAIEYHTFYRLKFHHHRSQRPGRIQLFRLGSTFRYRGRTEYESVHREELVGSSPAPPRRISANERFARRPSQRYAPRQRRKLAEKAEVPEGTIKMPPTTTISPSVVATMAPASKSEESKQPQRIRSPPTAIPVPSPSTSPRKKDNAHSPNFVTTIEINRKSNGEKRGQRHLAREPRNIGSTRIPSLIPAAGGVSSAASNCPAASPAAPSRQLLKCTQIPVVRAGGVHRTAPERIMGPVAERGMATEL